MPNDDTIKLLKECNAGIKMAVTGLKEVEPRILDANMKKSISESIERHEKIGDKTHELLNKYKDSEKEPNPVAEAMSWLKINVNCLIDSSDSEIAKLMMDGCNMGIQSISKYLNQYKAADKEIKDIVDDVVREEEGLMKDLRAYI